MEILLTSLNAKFIHSSLSIHSLKAYCKDFKKNIEIEEYTINHSDDYIISKIYKKKPKLIGFSCYIWNIEETMNIAKVLHKVLPDTLILLGGPEVSYNPKEFLEKEYIHFVILGEGEESFYQLIYELYNSKNYSHIKSLGYKENNVPNINNDKYKIELAEIPFVYSDLTIFENKILYYETSRGCPYKCQYCLSSVENGVKFLNIERVFSDLKYFLNNKVTQVKFVDRTFNAKKSHAKAIWKFLIDNDNNYTNFHFEISGDIIDDEIIQLLSLARTGLFQFEIGVQTTNEKTLKEIERYANKDKLFENIVKIQELKNIHVHLDLIAGLPHENIESFQKSFDDVYALHPDQLQLGFLKLLEGSGLRNNADKYGIVYRERPPFEVLKTEVLSFEDVLTLKNVCQMVEKYYNSGQFVATIMFMESLFDSPYKLYFQLNSFYEKNNYDESSHKKMFYFEFLIEFINYIRPTEKKRVAELLRFDIFTNENVKNLPESICNDIANVIKISWNNIYEDETLFEQHFKNGITKKQILRNTHVDCFSFDIIEFIESGKIKELESTVIFDYYKLMDCKEVHLFDNVRIKKVKTRGKYEQKGKS